MLSIRCGQQPKRRSAICSNNLNHCKICTLATEQVCLQVKNISRPVPGFAGTKLVRLMIDCHNKRWEVQSDSKTQPYWFLYSLVTDFKYLKSTSIDVSNAVGNAIVSGDNLVTVSSSETRHQTADWLHPLRWFLRRCLFRRGADDRRRQFARIIVRIGVVRWRSTRHTHARTCWRRSAHRHVRLRHGGRWQPMLQLTKRKSRRVQCIQRSPVLCQRM